MAGGFHEKKTPLQQSRDENKDFVRFNNALSPISLDSHLIKLIKLHSGGVLNWFYNLINNLNCSLPSFPGN